MKFNKQDLIDALEEEGPLAETMVSHYTGSSRWSKHYRRVFKFQGKLYETAYRHGATESQDESPYEYDSDEIECREVVPREKTITEYVIAEATKQEIPN